MRPDIQPVILAGGAGRRLWPLSTAARPKPFLKIDAGGLDFLGLTARRAAGMKAPIVVGNVVHRPMILQSLMAAGAVPGRLLLEPCGRGTAPALAAAAHLCAHGDDPLLLVLPSDHVIDDDVAFHGAVAAGAAAAEEGSIVTFGVVPRRAEARYGYIHAPAAQGPAPIARFVEKPSKATARAYLRSGDWLWNSGMFLLRARAALALLPPDIAEGAAQAVRRASALRESVLLAEEAWRDLPDISIDRAIMERTTDGIVVPVDMGWDDIGTWPALLGMAGRGRLRVRRKLA